MSQTFLLTFTDLTQFTRWPAGPVRFCALKVIHDHDLPCLQRGSQNLFDIHLKGCGVRRSFQDHGRSHAFKGKRSNEGGILATIAWNASSGPLSFWGTSIQRRQGNVGAALIKKHQRFRRKLARVLSPSGPLLLVALCRPERLFFPSGQRNRLDRSSPVQIQETCCVWKFPYDDSITTGIVG